MMMINYVHYKVLCAGLEASQGPKPDLQEYHYKNIIHLGSSTPDTGKNESAKGTRVQAKLSKRRRRTRDRPFRLEKLQPPKRLDWGRHSRGTENLAKSIFIQYSLEQYL